MVQLKTDYILYHYIYVTNFYLHRQRYYKSQINSEYKIVLEIREAISEWQLASFRNSLIYR